MDISGKIFNGKYIESAVPWNTMFMKWLGSVQRFLLGQSKTLKIPVIFLRLARYFEKKTSSHVEK